jgi:uncharacterized metal-binding protein
MQPPASPVGVFAEVERIELAESAERVLAVHGCLP